MINKQRILIVAAHPDDEILGCGGIMAKYSKNNDIYVVILGEGITSRYNNKEEIKKEELLKLQNQSKKVGKIIGVKENFFFNFPDNKFDTVPLLNIVKKIEKIIKEINPEIIYTHCCGDLNIDHRITFQAVLTATRPVNNSVKKIYSFEVLSSTEWSYDRIGEQFSPNVYENILGVINKKMKAMQIYKGELKKYPHSRSLEGIKILAQKRGMEAGLKYAEAFELIKWIN
jgi:LmbE family N-acetylglucosaminyl deacetylase